MTDVAFPHEGNMTKTSFQQVLPVVLDRLKSHRGKYILYSHNCISLHCQIYLTLEK